MTPGQRSEFENLQAEQLRPGVALVELVLHWPDESQVALRFCRAETELLREGIT